MNVWKDEMERIKRLKRTIYRPPLSIKKQRVTTRAQMPGKVKVFTEDEIFLFKIRNYQREREMEKEG